MRGRAVVVAVVGAWALLGSSPALAEVGEAWLLQGVLWYSHEGPPSAQACVATRPGETPGEGPLLVVRDGADAWRIVTYWFSDAPLLHCHIARTCEATGQIRTGLEGTCVGPPGEAGTVRLVPTTATRWWFVLEMHGPGGAFDHMDGDVHGGPLVPPSAGP